MSSKENAAVAGAIGELPPIGIALARVAAEVGSVGKNDRNAQQGFNFRGIDAVLNAVGPVLHRHGVTVIPEVQASAWETVEVGSKKTSMRSCTLTVRYRFHGPAGDHLDATVVGEALDAGDKSASKAMSVAFRTVLLQVLAIPSGDRDPDHDSYERDPAPAAVPTQKAKGRNGQTPIMAVISAAREAGFEGDALAADVAARHNGRVLGDFTDAQLRDEWRHWRAKSTPPADPAAEPSAAEQQMNP